MCADLGFERPSTRFSGTGLFLNLVAYSGECPIAAYALHDTSGSGREMVYFARKEFQWPGDSLSRHTGEINAWLQDHQPPMEKTKLKSVDQVATLEINPSVYFLPGSSSYGRYAAPGLGTTDILRRATDNDRLLMFAIVAMPTNSKMKNFHVEIDGPELESLKPESWDWLSAYAEFLGGSINYPVIGTPLSYEF